MSKIKVLMLRHVSALRKKRPEKLFVGYLKFIYRNFSLRKLHFTQISLISYE